MPGFHAHIRLAFASATLGLLLTGPLHAELPVSADAVAQIAAALPQQAPAKPAQPRNVLVFTRTQAFRHKSIPVGVKAIQMLGERTRAFTAVHSEDPAMFETDALNDFDAVIMLNTTGECLADSADATAATDPSNLRRQENLQRFVTSGKGLVGIHSATDTMYSSKDYGDMIGGWFTGHPWHTKVPLKVDSPNHPLTAMFDPTEGFVVYDEIYQFAPRNSQESFGGYQPYSRDQLHVLLSLDASKFDVSAGKRTDRDYAISWTHEVGDGRVFYTVLGHNDFIFWDPLVLRHYLAGIQYAMGDLPADAEPSRAQDRK